MAEKRAVNAQLDVFDNFIRQQARALHAHDTPPVNRHDWQKRRSEIGTAAFSAMGPFPQHPCALETRLIGSLKRAGYRIEKLIFQSRPDVWVTAHAYVPEPSKGKIPAVLAVHGHWPWARRDPVVQARCLGLVKLGFFVLAVDAFGAGERYPEPAAGAYHGGLFGSSLWPAGHTLLGMQVYDNQRAVDYLQSRPEVDGDRLGITGASGGGNQTMYAGALDERFRAVVPVCSVGTYQAYLKAACCVCEVLPGALRFAEEGDILSLVCPRALMVINATRDAFQFSPGEAKKSLARAATVFKLFGVENKLRHDLFESGHAYSQPMREAMYGWMTRWLKDQGDGKPVSEPAHTLEKVEDLTCFPDKKRPKAFLFPPTFAAREARSQLAAIYNQRPDHPEAWESNAVYLRDQLRKHVFGPFTSSTAANPVKIGASETAGLIKSTSFVLQPEPGLSLPVVLKTRSGKKGKQSVCIILHMDGAADALQHPLADALLGQEWTLAAPDLRGTGSSRPANDGIAGAADHNSAEHALWVGRPLLGQWIADVFCLLSWLAGQPNLDQNRVGLVGLGNAGILALSAASLQENKITGVATVDMPTTLITDRAYGPDMRMGLLAPGMLRFTDIPHLAALTAPRRLLISGGRTSQDIPVSASSLALAFEFTRAIYGLYRSEKKLSVLTNMGVDAFARMF